MSVAMVETIGRMQSIQSRIDVLSGITPTVAAAAGSASTAGSEADFSETLNRALGLTGGGTAATDGTGSAGATGSTGVAGSEGVTGGAVTQAAMKYLGVPYVFGGEDASGMDCSGLVQRVYADLGIELPRLVSGQMHEGTEVASLADAQPGDLIVTDNADHIVIYAGDNKVIHAPYEGRTVSHVERWFDESDIVTIRRIVPTEGASTAALGVQALGAQALDLSALLGTAPAQNSTAAQNEAMLALARSTMLGGGSL